ncbi:hypothetical protein [uncultured Aquimarina sp.]|uniref:hypothetical protein n=1 Tax=uncultured Aquimarina sp. TaxID=575652 RepID=UPI00263432D4|nr:hypothetical protein [uncultured Aquimarina sp.]
MNYKIGHILLILTISIFGLLIFSCVENSKKEEKEIKAENIMTELKKYNLPEYFKELHKQELTFLKENVFYGLSTMNKNDKKQFSFSKADFKIVLERVEKLNIGIDYIDIYKGEKLVLSEFPEDYNLKSDNPKWYKSVFEKITSDQTELKFNATYELPDNIINELMK